MLFSMKRPIQCRKWGKEGQKWEQEARLEFGGPLDASVVRGRASKKAKCGYCT